jgi:2-keto-4-pentenoate hydratase/2-oxohepta-3-ene-1,7-dioic acid hydratase in catechol pathway
VVGADARSYDLSGITRDITGSFLANGGLEESAAALAADSKVQPPDFSEPPNTIVGPHDEVAIARNSAKTDWEVVLGVVIGRPTSYLASADQSRDHITGYVLANDVSERTFPLELSGGQWTKDKSARGFIPTGPWLVTPDEIDPPDLALRSWVNGEPRQHSVVELEAAGLGRHRTPFDSAEAAT